MTEVEKKKKRSQATVTEVKKKFLIPCRKEGKQGSKKENEIEQLDMMCMTNRIRKENDIEEKTISVTAALIELSAVLLYRTIHYEKRLFK